ncbi:MAG: ABC transporter substrate-binding protein [Variovorax sp.]|nr:ABC transporter substrate-binding protein [Variovorax sp.]
MNFRRLNSAVAAAVAAAVIPLSASAQGKEPVKVGLVTSKTGVWAEMGEEVLRGVRFAIDEANAQGGVDGRKIEVAEGDDEGNPDAGRRAAEKLAREGYKFIIGPIGSAVSLAIVQNLDRWDAMYFATISKSDKLTGDTCKMRSFRTVQSDAMDMAMVASWAKELKGSNFAIIAADYAWGHDSAASFKKAVESQGKKVPLTFFAPLGTKDYSPYISQVKDAKVDAIWGAVPARDGVNLMKQAGSFNLIPATPMLGHAMLSTFMINGTGKVQDGMRGTLGYAPDFDTPRNKAFVAAFQARYKRVPSDTEGLAYHGANVMLDGVRLAGSVKPLEVSKALSGAKLESIFGAVTVRAEDHQVLIPNFVGRVKMVDGELRPTVEEVFPPSTIPAPSPLCKL